MKKGIIVVMSLVMLLNVCLAGCSTAAPGATKATASTASSAATAGATGNQQIKYPLSAAKVTYKVFNPSTASAKWENLRLFQIMEELTNIHFEFTNTPANDYTTKQNLLLASGDLPDVFWNQLENNNIQAYGVQGGLLLNYAPLMKQHMPRTMALMAKYPVALVAVTEMNGGVYKLPKVSFTTSETGETLFARTDMLDAVGKPVPQTIEEFYDTLVALKKHGFSDKFSPLLPDTVDKLEYYLFPSFGDAYEPAFADAGDGKTVVFNTMTEQYRRYIEFLARLYAEKLLEPEIFSMDGSAIQAKLKANNGAVSTTGTLYTPVNFKSGNCEVVMIPPMTSQYTKTHKMRGNAYEKDGLISISVKAKNPELLLQYFDVWYSEDDVIPGLNGLSTKFGLRGETWDYANPEKTLYRRFDPPNGIKLTNEEYRTQYVAPSSQPPGYAVILVNSAGDAFQMMKAEQAVKNLMPYWKERFPIGFLKFTEKENEVIANKKTDIDTYLKTMKGKLITGAEPMSNWGNVVSTLEKMGIKDVIAVHQAAYDRFNKAKASVK